MYSRPAKASHLETIRYEIDMLDFCHKKLLENEGNWRDDKDFYVYVEAFLLHYRNLTEFFGNHGDLRVAQWKVWSPRKLTGMELGTISNKALYKKYRGPISQYLQHCNRIRAEKDRGWDVREMYRKIEPLLAEFQKLFPHEHSASRAEAIRPSSLLDAHTASTRSGVRPELKNSRISFQPGGREKE